VSHADASGRPTNGASRRAEQKARTTQALIDAALELFAANGFDATTADEIAERAGVSPRTFFRYFPTKERVLFFGEYDFVRSFAGVFLAQPYPVKEIDAVRGALALLAPGVARLRKRIKLYERAVASSLVLRGREQEHHDANAAVMAEAIARRRGLGEPDDSCRFVAQLSLFVLRRALDQWLAAPGRPDLAHHINAQFRQLTSAVCAR
jgi:AcrR family transcriptional regulator